VIEAREIGVSLATLHDLEPNKGEGRRQHALRKHDGASKEPLPA
jgi:hypothetical protein